MQPRAVGDGTRPQPLQKMGRIAVAACGKRDAALGQIRGAGYANGATPSAEAASFNRRSRLANGQDSRIARDR